MFEKLFKAKGMDSEEEGFEELCRMREEDENVEPVNEAYPVNEAGMVRASMGLLSMCDSDIYNKIQRIEPIDHDELPDYIYKDLCREIGERVIKDCDIRYQFDAVRDEVRFVAVSRK